MFFHMLFLLQTLLYLSIFVFPRITGSLREKMQYFQKSISNTHCFVQKHTLWDNFYRQTFTRTWRLNETGTETLAQMSSCKFCEIFKNTFFTEHLWTTTFDVSSVKLYSSTLLFIPGVSLWNKIEKSKMKW